MKGKVAFVFGAAVGYVFGTRAGRARYEQIKRGAQNVWNTAPVQRGAQAVRDLAQAQVGRVKDAAVQAGVNLLSGGSKSAGSKSGGSGAASPAQPPEAGAAPEASQPGDAK